MYDCLWWRGASHDIRFSLSYSPVYVSSILFYKPKKQTNSWWEHSYIFKLKDIKQKRNKYTALFLYVGASSLGTSIVFNRSRRGEKHKKTLAVHGFWSVGPMAQAPFVVLHVWGLNPTPPNNYLAKKKRKCLLYFLTFQKLGVVRGHPCCNKSTGETWFCFHFYV